MVNHLIRAHGGELVDLMVDADRAAQLKAESVAWPSWDLTPRQTCDLELLMNGGFSPLRGFMGRADHESVRDKMRLADGTLWPVPVTLDVPDEVAGKLEAGSHLALRDEEGVMLAAIEVAEVWEPDRRAEAAAVLGTDNPQHPGVAHLLNRTHRHYVGGRILGLQAPMHYDYVDLRRTPAQLRDYFHEHGWTKVVAFQTRNPMHRAHL